MYCLLFRSDFCLNLFTGAIAARLHAVNEFTTTSTTRFFYLLPRSISTGMIYSECYSLIPAHFSVVVPLRCRSRMELIWNSRADTGNTKAITDLPFRNAVDAFATLVVEPLSFFPVSVVRRPRGFWSRKSANGRARRSRRQIRWPSGQIVRCICVISMDQRGKQLNADLLSRGVLGLFSHVGLSSQCAELAGFAAKSAALGLGWRWRLNSVRKGLDTLSVRNVGQHLGGIL